MTEASLCKRIGQGDEDKVQNQMVESCLCRYSPNLKFCQKFLKKFLNVFQVGLGSLSTDLGGGEKRLEAFVEKRIDVEAQRCEDVIKVKMTIISCGVQFIFLSFCFALVLVSEVGCEFTKVSKHFFTSKQDNHKKNTHSYASKVLKQNKFLLTPKFG